MDELASKMEEELMDYLKTAEKAMGECTKETFDQCIQQSFGEIKGVRDKVIETIYSKVLPNTIIIAAVRIIDNITYDMYFADLFFLVIVLS